jgi:hypothetical protein
MPLHSTAFVGLRVVAISAILLLSLSVERFVLGGNIRTLDRKLNALLKNEIFGLEKADLRLISKNPKQLYLKLADKKKATAQQAGLIMEAARLDAIRPLSKLSSLLPPNPEVDMIKFSIVEHMVTTVFQASNIESLAKLRNDIESLTLPIPEIKLDDKNLTLTLGFEDQP